MESPSNRGKEFDSGRVFCDVVMKGGTTSGVVYPKAIGKLAETYQLRCIGGASAGAIAAAVAAAAEYRRQHARAKGKRKCEEQAGFDILNGLPDELGTPLAGHATLYHLFFPSRLARPLFGLLTRMLNIETKKGRVAAAALGLLRHFPLGGIIGAAVGLLVLIPACAYWQSVSGQGPLMMITSSAGVLLAALLFLTLAIASAGYAAYRRFGKVMLAQNFGLCTGMGEDGRELIPSLTPWLHQLLQKVAQPPPGELLTFGHLRTTRFTQDPDAETGIELRLMTTCLTAGRPYTLPFGQGDAYFFDVNELRNFFPDDVVEWMTQKGKRLVTDDPSSPNAPEDDGDKAPTVRERVSEFEQRTGKRLVRVPVGDDLPVIVAVRMSLSFPILLSAIGLYRIAFQREAANNAKRWHWAPIVERVYFTDGGVCSNLPVHMFDSALPSRPTFAINLRSDLPNDQGPGQIDTDRAPFTPRGNTAIGDRYTIGGENGAEATLSFLTAIIGTMQNWRDMLHRDTPGTKDRVITVRHTSKEGGLNLDMKQSAITALSESGQTAASRLVAAFAPPSGTPWREDSWVYQRWVRLRLLLPQVETLLGKMTRNIRNQKLSPTTLTLLKSSDTYICDSYPLDNNSASVAGDLLGKIESVHQYLETSHDWDSEAPRPRGELSAPPPF